MSLEKSSFKVVVLIGGFGSNLQALIDHASPSTYQISGVISHNPEVYGLERAQKADIPTEVVNHRHFDSRNAFDKKLTECILQFEPDLIILAGFMRILTDEFVQQFTNKILNIHPALLPKYKGLNTHQRVLDANESWHGTSVHLVTPELDGGPIVAQLKMPILEDDSAASLQQRTKIAEHWLYPKVVTWFSKRRLKTLQNSVVLDGSPLPATGIQFTYQQIEGLEI